MTDAPNIPFMPQKGQPPFHLRPSTPEEVATFQRMLREAEARRRVTAADRENERE